MLCAVSLYVHISNSQGDDAVALEKTDSQDSTPLEENPATGTDAESENENPFTGEELISAESIGNLNENPVRKVSYTEADMADFDEENPYSHCSWMICTVDKGGKNINISLKFDGKIPRSDDDNVYFFELPVYEKDENIREKEPVMAANKDFKVMSTIQYQDRLLFSRFVPALIYKGEYVPIYNGQYIVNPEILSENTIPYLNIESKKGILLDAATLGSEQLESLNVRRAVFNIPLSFITGETEDEACPTIEYEYDGETYRFNGYRCMLFDTIFTYLTENGYHSTAIVLNDWNKDFPELIHPKSRSRTGASMYYALNTEEEEGVKLLEATAMFLAQRYSSGEHGMVYDWVIANEINQQKIWNYMATGDVEYYTESFEKGFRIFYNAIRSVYGRARVYYSVDHDWNDNYGYNGAYFNARDIVENFNKCAKRGGNYDWSLSIHPYPAPLTKVRFWRGSFDKTENARRVTPMNLSVVTDFMQQEDYLNPYGKIRDIGVTELGFSSRSGEELQAAAFAYCYYIIEDNKYISSFLLNRQTDDSQALKSGLSLGLYNNDYSEKIITDVFRNVDNDKGREYIDEMLRIIGEESLEDALLKAR